MPTRFSEGQEDNRRDNVPSEVAFTQDMPQPTGDSLPQDGSLSLNDTELLDQEGLHDDETRILRGSEGTQTAESAVDVSKVPPPEDMTRTANTARE